MKKLICALIALVMIVSFAACGKKAKADLDYLVLVNKENKLPVGNVAPPQDN